MPVSNLAADSGLVKDAFGTVNTSLGNKIAVDKAQSFTTTQKNQGLSNLGAQAASSALTQVSTLAVSGNSGKILSIDGTGNVIASAAPSGGATLDSGGFTTVITN